MARRSGMAVLLIDVINSFDFPGARALIRAAKIAAPKIEDLCERARAERVPVIYVNDNFGRWSSDFKTILAEHRDPSRPAHEISERLTPKRGDYFVLKPQHSGFYATPLDLLLEHLEVRTLVLAGFATNLCVLFTANDAHMRGYQLVAPRDCTASNSPSLTRAALRHIEVALAGDTPLSRNVDFEALRRKPKKARGQPFQ